METCEQCGNELTEGGECMECGTMYEEEMMEQAEAVIDIRILDADKKVVTISPDQMKMLHDEGECDCGDVTLKFPTYNQDKK
jgi:methionyl-tRNA synthetase